MASTQASTQASISIFLDKKISPKSFMFLGEISTQFSLVFCGTGNSRYKYTYNMDKQKNTLNGKLAFL